MTCDCEHCVGMTSAWDMLEKKLCPEGKAAAKRKFSLSIGICKWMGCAILPW